MSKQTELTTIDENEKMPSFLKNERIEAEIDFDLSDIKISRLSLAHGIMDVVAQGNAKPGDFVDSITNENYGTEVEIIILKHERDWLLFGDDKKLLNRSKDGRYWDDGSEITEEQKWKNLHHTFFILIKNDLQPFPVYLSFSKSNIKEGSSLLNLIARFTSTGEPLFSRFYKLKSATAEGPKGKYFIQTVSPGSYVTKEEYEFSKRVWERIRGVDLERAEKEPSKPQGDDIGLE